MAHDRQSSGARTRLAPPARLRSVSENRLVYRYLARAPALCGTLPVEAVAAGPSTVPSGSCMLVVTLRLLVPGQIVEPLHGPRWLHPPWPPSGFGSTPPEPDPRRPPSPPDGGRPLPSLCVSYALPAAHGRSGLST